MRDISLEDAKRVVEAAGLCVGPPPLSEVVVQLNDDVEILLTITTNKVMLEDWEGEEYSVKEKDVELLRTTLNARHAWREKWL